MLGSSLGQISPASPRHFSSFAVCTRLNESRHGHVKLNSSAELSTCAGVRAYPQRSSNAVIGWKRRAARGRPRCEPVLQLPYLYCLYTKNPVPSKQTSLKLFSPSYNKHFLSRSCFDSPSQRIVQPRSLTQPSSYLYGILAAFKLRS